MTAGPGSPTRPQVLVVLGASGWLGTHVVSQAAERSCWVVVPVVRRTLASPDETEPVVHDVTTGEAGPLIRRVLEHTPRLVCIVDSVLDKRSDDAMRRSLEGSQRCVAELVAALGDRGIEVRVVLAGSTAAFAPRLLSSPYGRAKAAQMRGLAQLPVTTLVAVLPMLAGRPPAVPSSLDRLLPAASRLSVSVCDVADAALCVVGCAEAGDTGPGEALARATRRVPLHELRGLPPRRAAWLQTVLTLPLVLGMRATSGRGSPAWARHWSYALLATIPARLRTRIDHHQIPALVLSMGPSDAPPRARDLRRRAVATPTRHDERHSC